MRDFATNHAIVMQPDEGPSFWQPLPANGHADPKLTPAVTGFEEFSMGYQTIPPGSRVRRHRHRDQVELQICFNGQGTAVIGDRAYPLVPGTACFLGAEVDHEIDNGGADNLVMLWIVSPPGLEQFFEVIGRPRRRDEQPPTPFDRAADVASIERSLGVLATRDGTDEPQ